MTNLRTQLAGLTLTGAVIAGGLVNATAADAAESSPTTPPDAVNHTTTSPLTIETVRRAVEEARSAGAITAERTAMDGSTTVVIEGNDGATMELDTGDSGARLGTGSDRYGMYVAFNSFDQNLIISGALTAIASGMCALGPAVCAVAQVAALLASNAIGNGGGIRCGTKSLRVYPISHRAPRCA